MEDNTTEDNNESLSLTIEGQGGTRPISAFWKVAFGVTGLSLFIYLGKLIMRFVLGHKHVARVEVDEGKLTVFEEKRFVGREMNKSTEKFSKASVVSARLESRFPYLPTMLGLICLAVGVIVGLFLILDGIQGEWSPWIMSGVGVLLAGIVLDFGFSTLGASLPGKTSLALYLPDDRVLRILNCDEAKAIKLVNWLHE